MSVESGQLERSVLERKTADELNAIASTLGGKPPSRAKKAAVIDLILELVGAVDPAAGADEGASAAEASEPATEASEGDAPEGGAEGDSAQGSGAAADDGGETAEEAVGTPEEPAEKPDRERQPRRGGRPPRGADASAEDGSSAASDRSPDRERAGARQDQRDGGSGGNGRTGASDDADTAAEGDQGQGQGQREDAEPGNRRRRRRGRDRGERASDDQTQGEPVEVEGTLDLRDDGYGFLRIQGFLPSKDDVYVSVKQVRQFGLRKGDVVKGASRPASRNEKNPALLRIDAVNGADPDSARERPRFDDLTPLFPDERLRLERSGDPYNMTTRIIDLVSPIGKGQRGLIVSPPKAGKTTVVKQIVRSIERNDPEVALFVLLIDERPEEVTDMRRWLERGEVAASTFDRPTEEHTMVAELVIERAKRLVEEGRDVVVVLDGITRLTRAYNLAAPQSGRVMSGGVDAAALYPPKKFFGAARNVEEGGSLTILATALVDTGSKMDEVIFEEFKGTGNMELRLDRRMAERRVYPAIDVDGSSTRHEELLFDRTQLQQVWKLRRVLSAMSNDGAGGAGLEMLIERLETFKTNDEFLAEVAKAPSGA